MQYAHGAVILHLPHCNIILISAAEIMAESKAHAMTRQADAIASASSGPSRARPSAAICCGLTPKPGSSASAPPVNDNFLNAYADTARRIGTVVYGAFLGPEMYASAELRALHALGDEMAEAAFVVETAHRHQGLGSALMDRIITTAKNRGIHQLHMICARENQPDAAAGPRSSARSFSIDQGEASGRDRARPRHRPSRVLDEAMHDTTISSPPCSTGRGGEAACLAAPGVAVIIENARAARRSRAEHHRLRQPAPAPLHAAGGNPPGVGNALPLHASRKTTAASVTASAMSAGIDPLRQDLGQMRCRRTPSARRLPQRERSWADCQLSSRSAFVELGHQMGPHRKGQPPRRRAIARAHEREGGEMLARMASPHATDGPPTMRAGVLQVVNASCASLLRPAPPIHLPPRMWGKGG